LYAAVSGYFTPIDESNVLKAQDALIAYLEDSAVFGPLLYNISEEFDEQDFEPAIEHFFKNVFSA
jgi:hypothetical protein